MSYFKKCLACAFILSPNIFASTYNQSLRGSSRDVFDNLLLNPAFVLPEGDKNYFRIGKESGAAAIYKYGAYGLGLQLDTLADARLVTGTFTSKEAPLSVAASNSTLLRAGIESVTKRSVPVILTLGTPFSGAKHGLSILYHSGTFDEDLQLAVPGRTEKVRVFSPSVAEVGVLWGMISGPLEASLGVLHSKFKVATTRKNHDGDLSTPDPTTDYMDDGVSKQESKSYDFLLRYQIMAWKPSIAFSHTDINLELWDVNDSKTAGTLYSSDKAIVTNTLSVSADRIDSVGNQVSIFSRPRLSFARDYRNGSRYKGRFDEVQFKTSHGAEVILAPWLVGRAGIEAVLYTKSTFKDTYYATAGQKDNSESDTADRTFIFEEGVSPAFGLGFQFDSFTLDAAVSQDGSSSIGFTDSFFSMIQLTAIY